MPKYPKPNPKSSLLQRAREQAENSSFKLWKPSGPDDGIEGTILKITRGGKFDSFFYHLQTDTGVQVVAASDQTVLGQKLAKLDPKEGERIGILFLGEEKSTSGRTFKNWSIVVERERLPATRDGDEQGRLV